MILTQFISMTKRRLFHNLEVPSEESNISVNPLIEKLGIPLEEEDFSTDHSDILMKVREETMLVEGNLPKASEILPSLEVLDRELLEAISAATKRRKIYSYPSYSNQWSYVHALSGRQSQYHPFLPGFLVFPFDPNTEIAQAAHISAMMLREVFLCLNINQEDAFSQTNHNLLIVKQTALESVFQSIGRQLILRVAVATEHLKTQLQDAMMIKLDKTDENYIRRLSNGTAYLHPSKVGFLVYIFDSKKEGLSAAQHRVTALRNAFNSFNIDKMDASSQINHNLLIVKQASLGIVFNNLGEKISLRIMPAPEFLKNQLLDNTITFLRNADENYIRKLGQKIAYQHPSHEDYVAFVFDPNKEGKRAAENYAAAVKRGLDNLNIDREKAFSQTKQNICIVEKVALEKLYKHRNYKNLPTIMIAPETLSETLKLSARKLPISQKPVIIVPTNSTMISSTYEMPANNIAIGNGQGVFTSIVEPLLYKEVNLVPSFQSLKKQAPESFLKGRGLQLESEAPSDKIKNIDNDTQSLDVKVKHFQEFLENFKKDPKISEKVKYHASQLALALENLSSHLSSSQDNAKIIESMLGYHSKAIPFTNLVLKEYPQLWKRIIAPLAEEIYLTHSHRNIHSL